MSDLDTKAVQDAANLDRSQLSQGSQARNEHWELIGRANEDIKQLIGRVSALEKGQESLSKNVWWIMWVGGLLVLAIIAGLLAVVKDYLSATMM